jgi:hypothetical protein
MVLTLSHWPNQGRNWRAAVPFDDTNDAGQSSAPLAGCSTIAVL